MFESALVSFGKTMFGLHSRNVVELEHYTEISSRNYSKRFVSCIKTSIQSLSYLKL